MGKETRIVTLSHTSSLTRGVLQDVRYAIRLLWRQPRPAVLSIVTMALGIGFTTALFSVTYGVLLKPLAWPNGDRVVVLKETRGGQAPRFGAFTNAAYLAWREQATTVSEIAAWSPRIVTLTGLGDSERIRITAATAGLFPVLGVTPLLGSFFGQADEASPVVVLSEGFWRERFGADRDAIGRPLHIDGQPHTIVGVLPDRWMYPDRQSRAIVPFAVRPAAGNFLSLFNAVAALRPGATPAQAAAEGTARGQFAADTGLTTTAIFGNRGPVAISANALRAAMTADIRAPLLVLFAAVVLLLATATANVAGVQLARTSTRIRELAIRAALGAGTVRVTRQLLVEHLLLGAAGGLGGVAIARVLHDAMPSLLPADFPRVDDLRVDTVVLAFAVPMSIATSVLCGLFPALLVRRSNLVGALAKDGPGPAWTGGRSRTAQGRLVIMTGQVAIACVLLVGASLLGRSFVALLNADRGYQPAGVLSARLSMPATMFPSAERRLALADGVLRRLETVPAIAEAALTSEQPLTPGGSTAAFEMKSRSADGGVVRVQASPRIVSPRYFHVLDVRAVAGRTFDESDTERASRVVVVNEAFARRYLGDSPLGARMPMAAYGPADGEPVETTVIGVVANVRYVTNTDTSHPELYYLHRQMDGRLPVQTLTLLVRTRGDPVAAAPALRAAVRDADRSLALDAVMALDERVRATLAKPRLYATLLAGFAGCALLIAAVGLYGVLSYAVSQRSRELAVRVALGARRADIVRLVLRQGLVVTVVGLTAGMIASAWLTQVIAAQLYGVTPHDTLTFVAVPLVLLGVATVACLVPARRAAAADPLRLLRMD
jgi:predicted permease